MIKSKITKKIPSITVEKITVLNIDREKKVYKTGLCAWRLQKHSAMYGGAIDIAKQGIKLDDKSFSLNKSQKLDQFTEEYYIKGGRIYWHDGGNLNFAKDTVLGIFMEIKIDEFFGKESIWPYIREIMRDYVAQVYRNIRQDLGFNLNSRKLADFWLTPEKINNIKVVRGLEKLLSTEGKIKYQWWGYTYRLVDKLTGLYQVGYATEPDFRRFNFYLINTFFEHRRHYFASGEKHIYGYMYEYLESLHPNGIDFFRNSDDRPDFVKLNEAINNRFDFKITGVFWGENLMKQAEDEQIKVGKLSESEIKKLIPAITSIINKYGIHWQYFGKALNDPKASRLGSPSPNNLLPYIAAYSALGYSVHEIRNALKRYHRYRKSERMLYNFINNHYGDIRELRGRFLNPVFEKVEQSDLTKEQIRQIYFNYFSSNAKRYFDTDKFIDLLSQGWHIKDIANKLHMSRNTLDIFSSLLIETEYPELRIYEFSDGKERPSANDLQIYLCAPKMLAYYYRGFTLNQIGQKYKSKNRPNGFDHSTVARYILKFYDFENFSSESIQKQVRSLRGTFYKFAMKTRIKDPLALSDLRCILLSIPREKLKSINDLVRKTTPLLGKRNRIEALIKEYFMASLKEGLKTPDYQYYRYPKKWSLLDIAKVAVIGNVLKTYYKAASRKHGNVKFTIKKIVDDVEFFSDSQVVIDWTKFLYGWTPQDAIAFFSTHSLYPDHYKLRFGVNVYIPRI